MEKNTKANDACTITEDSSTTADDTNAEMHMYACVPGYTQDHAHVLKLEQQLCFSVYTFSRKIAKLYRPYLDKLHITYPQYLVTLVLGECGTCTVSELGERLFLDSGTLTPLLKRMQEAGLVSRSRSEDDERKVIAALTEQGYQLWQKLKDIHDELSQHIHVSLDEYTKILAEFQQLTARISQIWSGGQE